MIFRNQIYCDSESGHRYRIIQVVKKLDEVWMVDLDKKLLFPQKSKLHEFEEMIDLEVMNKESEIYTLNNNEIDTTSDLQIKLFNKRWTIIEFVLIGNESKLLNDSAYKKEVFIFAQTKFNCSEMTIRRAISDYFRYGMSKSAVRPKYLNCGGVSKERIVGNKKIGAPMKSLRRGKVMKGMNIKSKDKENIINNIKKYFLKENSLTLKICYQKLLIDHYSEVIQNEFDELEYRVLSRDQIPSLNQYYYWYKKIFSNNRDNIRLKKGDRNYNLNERTLLSDSLVNTVGPGHKYQIDSTVLDVYIVSKYDSNRILGRPVIFIVIDVYSRMITGVYVGVDHASYRTSTMAILNIVEDKKEMCSKYGINIAEKAWPKSLLPGVLEADRAELEGENIEAITEQLGITIEIKPPYRADLKGIVERFFNTINKKIKMLVPGGVDIEKIKRGDRDYRLDAVLNLTEIRKIVLYIVIEHNNTVIEKYIPEKDLIYDSIELTPSKIWNWGLKNSGAMMTERDYNYIKYCLLPRKKVVISKKGIHFMKGFYRLDDMEVFDKLLGEGIKRVTLRYDTRNMKTVYVEYKIDGKESISEAFLTEKSERYITQEYEELEMLNEIMDDIIREEKENEKNININLVNKIEEVVEIAEERKSMYRKPNSKRAKLEGIKDNRRIESKMIHQEESFIKDKEIRETKEITNDKSLSRKRASKKRITDYYNKK